MSTKPSPATPSRRGAFSRRLDVDEVPSDGLERSIEATPEECRAIARELDIPAVQSLAARLTVEPRSNGRFDVTGTLEAEITEVCVVTLEPFGTRVTQAIELTFASVADAPTAPGMRKDPRTVRSRRARAGEDARPPSPVPHDEEADPPDPLVDGTIDLGAVALEFLTLARDIHPRKPGVHFTDTVVGETGTPSPFAALQRLKDHS